MSSLECTETRRRPVFVLATQAVIGCVRGILRGIDRWHAAGATFRHLQSLSDEQLKDIGLHRSQIAYLVGNHTETSMRGHHGEN